MDEVKKKSMIEKIELSKASIALPDELPARPDLSQFPDHVLRSTAVETLLQQNDELMSRLSVNLRRVSQLENTIDSQEKAVKKFKHHYEVLKDEVYILNEKSKKTENEALQKKEEYLVLLEKYKAIDLEYSRLFKTHDEEKINWIKKNQRIAGRLKSHLRYRKNISPLIKKLKEKHKQLVQSHNQLSQQNITLKEKLTTLTGYIQKQSETFHADKKQLLTDYKKSSDELKAQELKVAQLSKKVEKINQEAIALKNDNISKTRTLEEIQNNEASRFEKKQKEAEDYKRELKKIKIENLELAQANQEFKSSLAAGISEQEELCEQLENTQLFFSSLQKQFEKEQAKTASLQKINRQLSQEMNSYRSTIQSLKNLRDKKMLDKKSPSDSLPASAPARNEIQESTAINKIENLIFEIERDFR